MKKKGRLYKVTTINGHGERHEIMYSPKKSMIENTLKTEDRDIKVEHLGYKTIIIDTDEYDIVFRVPELDNLVIREGEPGYRTLSTNLFCSEFRDLQEKIQSWYDD